MARFKLADVVVKEHHIWWNDRGTDNSHKVDVTEVYISPDTCGNYFIVPTVASERTFTYKCGWKELSILPLGDELYEVKLWAVSSPHVRSENAFLTLELTKGQLIEWHGNDVWFEKELHYIVRRVGKKVYRSDSNSTSKKQAYRCIKCHYLLTTILEEHVCGGTLGEMGVWKQNYTVDETTMATVELR